MMTYFPVYTTLTGNKVNYTHLQKTPYLQTNEG
jgi:hypothetical protein